MNNTLKALKTMAIKSRLANTIRQQLYKKQLKEITEKEKVIFFDNLFQANLEMHSELNNLKQKRKQKTLIVKQRVERGYYTKKLVKAQAHKVNNRFKKEQADTNEDKLGVEGTFI